MYIKSVSNSVIAYLCLWNNFYNVVFKIKLKLFMPQCQSPPQSGFLTDVVGT